MNNKLPRNCFIFDDFDTETCEPIKRYYYLISDYKLEHYKQCIKDSPNKKQAREQIEKLKQEIKDLKTNFYLLKTKYEQLTEANQKLASHNINLCTQIKIYENKLAEMKGEDNV